MREVSQQNDEYKVINRIIELSENSPSTILGTIIKSSPGRPKVDSGHRSSFEPISYLGVAYDEGDDSFMQSHYCRSEDSIVLEDESGRVELELCLKDNKTVSGVESLPSGAVVAVDGMVGSTGIFSVMKIHFPQMENDANPIDTIDIEDSLVAFVSGLNCGEGELSSEESSLNREMLIDYLTGHFSMKHGSKICRVIIAGGGCAKPSKPKGSEVTWNPTSSKEINKENGTAPISELDLFISELCAAGIQVDYIPGLSDPTNANWPQKPLHPCLLPMAERYGMLNRSPNPYGAIIGGLEFLGSDGQNIADLQRYVARRCENTSEERKDVELENISSLEALELTLLFNHMAPTGPDSLPTFPAEKEDPFVISKCPNVYFAGNCMQYETTLKNSRTRLICIPSFSKSGKAVLMNLKTLKCEAIKFEGEVNK
jgi:DNA polymerase delta subunit 2